MINKFVKEIYKEAGLETDGFICNNKMIILAPIKDFISSFLFDKPQANCYLHWFIQPIYYPSLYICLTYGWRLGAERKIFSLDNENDMQFTKTEMIRLIKESKHHVLDIKTPMDFYNKFNDLSIFDNFKKAMIDPFLHKEMMAITLCYTGNKDYKNIIDGALDYWSTSDRTQLSWMQDITIRLKKLREYCDNGTRNELFKEWESYTVKNLRLEKYYKPEFWLNGGE